MFKQPQDRTRIGESIANDGLGMGRLSHAARSLQDLDLYPSTLNFYFDPPDAEFPIEVLTDLAEARQTVLCSISEARMRGIPQQEADRELDKILQRHLPLNRNHAIPRIGEKQVIIERSQDALSHFVLRVVYSESADFQAWFVNMESELLMRRMKSEDNHVRNKFFWSVFRNVPLLSLEDKKKYIKELCMSGGMTEFEVYNMDFYVVPFRNANNLVSRRKVFLNRGMAYVPSTEQCSLILEAFKSHLSRNLRLLSALNPGLVSGKMKTILDIVSSRCQRIFRTSVSFPSRSSTLASRSSEGTPGTIDPPSYSNIDQIMRFFPPCMRNIQLILAKSGHLKYNDRLKYGLFLKWIGMSFPDSMIFWERSMYSVPPSTFKREYSYNIRYNYGLEGKRKDFPPWSCRDILSRDYPAGNHGCPFLELPKTDLVAFLESGYSCSSQNAEEIAGMAKHNHYQLACTSLLASVLEPSKDLSVPSNDEILETPNQFYDRASSKMPG